MNILISLVIKSELKRKKQGQNKDKTSNLKKRSFLKLFINYNKLIKKLLLNKPAT